MKILLAYFLPDNVIPLIGPFSLLLVGHFVEKHYTGRMALFLNFVALITYFYNLHPLPLWLVIYIDIMTIIGIVAFFSYIFRISLPKEFYIIASIGSSFITGLVLLWGAITY